MATLGRRQQPRVLRRLPEVLPPMFRHTRVWSRFRAGNSPYRAESERCLASDHARMELLVQVRTAPELLHWRASLRRPGSLLRPLYSVGVWERFGDGLRNSSNQESADRSQRAVPPRCWALARGYRRDGFFGLLGGFGIELFGRGGGGAFRGAAPRFESFLPRVC